MMNYIPPKNPAAFCAAKRWQMSYRQIKAKGCLDARKQCKYGNPTNQCRYLVKIGDHPLWRQLQREQEKKKSAKIEVV